jgi:glutaconyl-CoA/methylmalonyl-CoA decarboxylase subunit gamma
MKKFKFTIEERVYEVNIIDIDDNIADVEVNGKHYKVEVDKTIQQSKTPKIVRTEPIPSTDVHPSIAKTTSPVAKVTSPVAAKTGGTINAPLPGIILEVMVKVGDEVSIGQRLLVLEAMKMENNIDSDKEGKVIEVKVQKGDSIMEGDVLVVIG